MRWPPQRGTIILGLAAGSAAYWLVGQLIGAHPDGALLGFSGSMWLVWATWQQDARKREDRQRRRPNGNGNGHARE